MVWSRDNVQIICGDCLDVLRDMPAGSVSCVIADPPYGINTKSDATGKLNPWADLCNAAAWYAIWIGECRRVLADDGCLWSFLNWRSLPTFQKASCDLRWPIESVMVWDKQWIGPGGSRGLRPSYEMVALWCGPGFSIDNRGAPDIKAVKWASYKPTGHPAEKPADLVSWILDISGTTGCVLDPFTGSGTVPFVAARRGLPCVAVEIDPVHHAAAIRRVESEMAQSVMFPRAEL